jgi:hypothetical protein
MPTLTRAGAPLTNEINVTPMIDVLPVRLVRPERSARGCARCTTVAPTRCCS